MEQLPLGDLINAVPDAVIVVDGETCLRFANRAAERLFGWRVEDRLGLESVELVHPDDLEFALLSTQTVMQKEVGSPIELRVMTATGWRLVEVIGASYSGPDLPNGIVLSLRDLTERRRWEVAGDDLARFRTLVQNAPAITMLTTADGTIRAVSAALTRVLGHDPAEVDGRPLAELVVESDRQTLVEALERATATEVEPGDRRWVSVEVEMRSRQGSSVPVQLTVVDLLDDPTVAGLVVSGQDISELHDARQKLAHAAEHDDLTGLPNRAHLTRHLAARLGPDGPRATAVAFMDLDRFKIMNDLFGHEVGDEILVTVARRIENTLRAGDLVARLGGDEFIVVASAANQGEVEQLRSRLERAVTEPMRLRTGPLQVFASIGVVVAHPGDGIDDILNEADAAMYEVKSKSRGTMGRTRPLAERRSLAEDLDGAFRLGQFEVHYQPTIELETARMVGLEALVRWHHPRRGLLLPADFLDVVEDARRDVELGDLVISTAIGDLKEFRTATGDELTIGLNLSTSLLDEPGFADRLSGLVTGSGVAPESVVLEISERGLMDPDDDEKARPVRTALCSLSAIGFRIAVDDFGTGYSSLSHLVSFPVDMLKIDRSFVLGLGEDQSRESIVAALTVLARESGMDVVAEGIEQESQLSALRRLGCGYGQGYLFSRPLPRTDVLAELRGRELLTSI